MVKRKAEGKGKTAAYRQLFANKLQMQVILPAYHIAVSQIQKRNELDVELYIDEDKELFHSLFQNKDAIESDAHLSFE